MSLITPTGQKVQPRVFWYRQPDDGQWIPSIVIVPTEQEVWRLSQTHHVWWHRRPEDGQWIPSIVTLPLEPPAELHLAEHLAWVQQARMCATCAIGYLQNDPVDMGGWHMSGWYCNSMDLTGRVVCECPCSPDLDGEKDGMERYTGYYDNDFQDDLPF